MPKSKLIRFTTLFLFLTFLIESLICGVFVLFLIFCLRFWSSVPWNQTQMLLEQTITGVVLCLWRRFIFVSCFLSPAECEAVKCLLPRVCSSSSQTVAASVCRVSNRLHTLQHAVFLEEGTQRRFPAPFTHKVSP